LNYTRDWRRRRKGHRRKKEVPGGTLAIKKKRASRVNLALEKRRKAKEEERGLAKGVPSHNKKKSKHNQGDWWERKKGRWTEEGRAKERRTKTT